MTTRQEPCILLAEAAKRFKSGAGWGAHLPFTYPYSDFPNALCIVLWHNQTSLQSV